MNIIENPTKPDLDKIQAELESENNTEITNIWADLELEPYYVIMKDGDNVVGVATLNTAGALELHKLYVVPQYRKHGVAKKLLNYIIEALKNNHDSLYVEFVSESRVFWQKITSTLHIEKVDDRKFCINLNG
jgi:GNAT superfamily N-acetyltransferase